MQLKSKKEDPSNKKQLSRSFEDAEIGRDVRADDTTSAEKRPTFAQSVDRHVLDHQKGFGEVKPTMDDQSSNKGHGTLSSDSRKSPLPEKGVKIEIHRGYNDENIIQEGDAYVT